MEQNPGRGTLILVLGILGLVCCAIAGPVAWMLGKQDMAKIKAGEIAQEAEQMTKIGMILGIVGTVVLCLQLLAGCAYAVIVGIAIMSAPKGKVALDVFNALGWSM